MASQPHAYTCLQYRLPDDWYLQVIKGAHGASCDDDEMGFGCDKYGVRMCKAIAGGVVEGAEAACAGANGNPARTGPKGCAVCASYTEIPHTPADPET
jgi:hypothetical protein